MFGDDKTLAAAFAVLMVGLALSACTVVERDQRSSAPPTVVMQPAPQQPPAAVIVR
jgi:hypothetical protein